MNPITNSVIKEQMRQRNESMAQSREAQIRSQLTANLNSLSYKSKHNFSPFGIGGGILGIVLAVSGVGFSGILVGLAVGTGVWIAMNQSVKTSNAGIDSEKQRLQDAANNEIRQEYMRADQRTQQEITAYERDVKMYAQKVMAKSESIAPMVEHVVGMFQRMISHADAGAHMKFIEADFTYQVINSGIKYSYQSRYTNPQDNYDFNKERYRDLNSPAECEGLAQALAKLVINKMKSIYPPNSINISLNHNDAQVTLHFKGANKNFVPARDIM